MGTTTFGSRTSADEVLAGRDLRGRHMIVTGANTGIGYATARALAAAGASMTLACRNEETGQAAVDRIADRHPGADVRLRPLDLGSLDSVDAFVDAWGDDPLDVIIANAGLVAPDYAETADGIERTVGVCHVGHAALVLGLLPRLLESDDARVVMVASGSHQSPPTLDWDRFPMTRERYKMMVAYGQAKLCNVLFANELQRRHGDDGIMAASLHPGALVTTDIGRGSVLTRVGMALASPFTKSPDQGAATSVVAAVAPNREALAGQYLSDCAVAEASPEARDPAVAARLWDWTDEVLRTHRSGAAR